MPDGTATFSGPDGSSVNTGTMETPGGTPGVQGGRVVVPTGSTTPATVSAVVTQGTTTTPPTVEVSGGTVTQVRVTLALGVDLAPAQYSEFKSTYTSALATALSLPTKRFEWIYVGPRRSIGARLQSAKTAAPCSAATPPGASCRVTWTLPSLPVGDWNVTLRHGGLSVPTTMVSQPRLKVTPNANRCLRPGATAPLARSVTTTKGAKLAVVAVAVKGSRLTCRGTAGTTGRVASGRAPRVIARSAAAMRRPAALRRLPRGDYALLWVSASANTPSAPVTTFLKVQ